MKILGYDYTIDIEKTGEEISGAGKFISSTQKIQLSSDLCDQQLKSTLLHEILEALNYHLELKLEHTTIMGLEVGLYQTLVDNGIDLSPLLKGAKK
jgi:hypothetical protein